MSKDIKEISLIKNGTTFLFRYEVGQEAKLLDDLIEKVHKGVFDWFDAAIVSHHLGQHLAKELKAFLPKPAGGAA